MADLGEEVEVLAERAPGDQRPVVAEGVQALGLEDPRVVRDRGVAPAAVPDHLGRDPLPDRALRGRVREQREVAVAVRVDEAGADDLPRGVDHPGGILGAVEPADLDDAAVLDRDVSEEGRAAGAVGDPAALDQDVEQGVTSRRPSLLVDAADVRTEPRVEDVAQPVPEEVEAEDDDHDREPGEDRQPRVDLHVGARAREHPSP